jgi:hypothetical protein
MRSPGLQVGFGQSMLGEVGYLLDRRITLARQDLQSVSDDALPGLLTEMEGTGIQPYMICRGWQLDQVAPGTLTELVNEPTLDYPGRPALTPQEYADEWNTYGIPAQERGVRLYAGCIHNIYPKTIAWLREAWRLMQVKPKYCSIHRYPEDAGGYETPHPGFTSRADEIEGRTGLRSVIGDIPFLVSDTGIRQGTRTVHTGPFGWRTTVLPERTVEYSAEGFEYDLAFYPRFGCDAVIWYQINSSLVDPNDQFGIRYPDGQDKIPVVNVFRNYQE